MYRALVLFILLATFAGAALAAAKTGAPSTNVELPVVIAPMSKDGQLTGYAYITAKIVATSQAASLQVHSKIPFIQDAFVRDVNAAPISKANDAAAVDQDGLAVRLTSDAQRIVGPAKISHVVIVRVQLAELRPKEALVAPPK